MNIPASRRLGRSWTSRSGRPETRPPGPADITITAAAGCVTRPCWPIEQVKRLHITPKRWLRRLLASSASRGPAGRHAKIAGRTAPVPGDPAAGHRDERTGSASKRDQVGHFLMTQAIPASGPRPAIGMAGTHTSRRCRQPRTHQPRSACEGTLPAVDRKLLGRISTFPSSTWPSGSIGDILARPSSRTARIAPMRWAIPAILVIPTYETTRAGIRSGAYAVLPVTQLNDTDHLDGWSDPSHRTSLRPS